ncbi:hypothetical protein B0H12DRAFT_299635 [Mycena haematopus]|nr:hypothetical protein B0H12DRAFT_299635 [Mycena haematopus]
MSMCSVAVLSASMSMLVMNNDLPTSMSTSWSGGRLLCRRCIGSTRRCLRAGAGLCCRGSGGPGAYADCLALWTWSCARRRQTFCVGGFLCDKCTIWSSYPPNDFVADVGGSEVIRVLDDIVSFGVHSLEAVTE